MDYLSDIITDIQKEECVLIIGPDIIDLGGKSFFETMCAELITNNTQTNLIDNAPQYIFPNEELLQLVHPRSETKIWRMIEAFYQKQTAFDEPLTKITQIPFHLIISLMPDDRLPKLFEKQNLDYNYGHYSREYSLKPIEKPVKEKPLVYNLLGDFNERDAIITFDHLFSFLLSIMGKKELPQELRETLKKAKTLVFLGVHFEKWYVQLLLRIITSNDQKDKYTILKKRDNNEVYTFVARRLELDFVETDPLKFLDSLYNECKQKGLLKKKRAKVFLSYCHLDKETVRLINRKFSENDIDVLIDEHSMKGGEKIEEFIHKIKEVDVVVPILSESSLLSRMVSKEIIATVEEKKNLYPCYIDKTILDDEIIDANAKSRVTEKLKTLIERRAQRGIANTEDLNIEEESWREYYSNLFKIVVPELRSKKCISLMEADFEKNIDIVINDIKGIAGAE